MSTRWHSGGWGPGVGRLCVVTAAAAGVVLGAGQIGAAPTSPVPSSGAERVAASLTTSFCPGDPFKGGDKGTPRVDLTGGVAAHAAPAKVLDGVIAPSDEPGEITIDDLTAATPDTSDSKPRRGPMSESVDTLGEQPQRVRGTADHAPGLEATQGFTTSGKRVQGLAATPCLAPTADAWLVAGGGQRGRQERLVLVNPGGNAVTARLDLVGTSHTDTPDRSVVIPAHGRQVVLLDAIGGTSAPQAVHVTTTGGLVVPTIVDNHLDGLTPAGVETVSPTMAPATRLVLPGNVRGSSRGMVLAAPGTRDAVVQIRRLGDDSSRGVKVVTVPADEVVDVDLPAGDGGVHSWVVESDEPVVAAGHVTTTDASGRSDMAWSVATPSFGGLGGVALPAATADVQRAVDVTAADGPASVDVLVLDDDGVTAERVDLDEGRSSALAVTSPTARAVWVRPRSGRVHAAALLLTRDGGPEAMATSLPILPARVSVRDVPVTQAR